MKEQILIISDTITFSLRLKQLFPINNIKHFITMVVFCPFLFYSLHFPLEWLILMPLSICETMQSSYSKSQRNMHSTLGQWYKFELQIAVVLDSLNEKYRSTLCGPSNWSDELSIMCSLFLDRKIAAAKCEQRGISSVLSTIIGQWEYVWLFN